ncbi:MAG: Fe-S cluster assembly protein SufD, partial [Pseudomonadota bacterium]|nr:Fe-S cluster assembly protein SufD [Pseudomonadota bacterium]
MAVEALRTRAEQAIAEQFSAALDALPGNAAVKSARQQAWASYAAAGLPHRRVEEWKYTDLRALLAEAYPPAPVVGEAVTPQAIDKALGAAMAGIDCQRLVIVDGKFRPELSDMSGFADRVEVLALTDALNAPPSWLPKLLGKVNPQESDPVAALNMAFLSGGIALRVADKVSLTKPVHIVHVHAANAPASLATRSVVSVGEGASLTLVESFVSASGKPLQRTAVTELSLGKDAGVEHVKFQNESSGAAHLGNWMVEIGEEARYRGFQLSAGSALARSQIFVRFAGEGALSHVSGTVLARGKQHSDTTMVIDHAVPGCESREHTKAVLDGDARVVIQCKAIVRPDAQKSDGHQMAQALLLSEAAEFDSKPELEIYADDVACGHGSTAGQIDEDLLFYLRARGISETEARALLVLAFASEAIDRVEHEAIRGALAEVTAGWLGTE